MVLLVAQHIVLLPIITYRSQATKMIPTNSQSKKNDRVRDQDLLVLIQSHIEHRTTVHSSCCPACRSLNQIQHRSCRFTTCRCSIYILQLIITKLDMFWDISHSEDSESVQYVKKKTFYCNLMCKLKVK